LFQVLLDYDMIIIFYGTLGNAFTCKCAFFMGCLARDGATGVITATVNISPVFNGLWLVTRIEYQEKGE
jgi:hypothetical protein